MMIIIFLVSFPCNFMLDEDCFRLFEIITISSSSNEFFSKRVSQGKDDDSMEEKTDSQLFYMNKKTNK